MVETDGGRKFSKRDFLIGAVAGGVGFQAARLLAPRAVEKPPEVAHKVSYSQAGEDLTVSFLFGYLKLPNPSYLDIGAWYPVDDSNTYYFYRQGGRGVLIEPNVDIVPEIKRERPGDTVLNVGIGVDAVKEANYYRMSVSGWNTFSKEQAEHAERTSGGQVKVQEVVKMPLVPVNDVMQEHFNGGAPDFLSIDVEGLDLAILKTLNFARHRPKVICVETLITGTTQENRDINEFLQSKDYVLRGASFVNGIFVDQALLNGTAKG